MRRLIALPADTPSLRLLADKAAEALAGLGHALDGLVLLVVADPAPHTLRHHGSIRLRVPDWLPALVNAGRAFVVIGAVSLFWVVTAWPGGSTTITFAAIFVLLLGPRADQAYGAALIFTVGILLDLVLTATVSFAVLPAIGPETFAGFSLVVGACLVPIGALLAGARKPWQRGLFTAMAVIFMPLLQPTNPMTYNSAQFYNVALGIVGGAVAAALSFRLMPPLSPAYRARRLLALTLRDLRRLAAGHVPRDWEGHVHGRLTALPDAATPLQRSQLLAALAAGSEILRLHHVAARLGIAGALDAALAEVAEGHSLRAAVRLAGLDALLAARDGAAPATQGLLRARAGILVLSEALTTHADYFDGAVR